VRGRALLGSSVRRWSGVGAAGSIACAFGGDWGGEAAEGVGVGVCVGVRVGVGLFSGALDSSGLRKVQRRRMPSAARRAISLVLLGRSVIVMNLRVTMASYAARVSWSLARSSWSSRSVVMVSAMSGRLAQAAIWRREMLCWREISVMGSVESNQVARRAWSSRASGAGVVFVVVALVMRVVWRVVGGVQGESCDGRCLLRTGVVGGARLFEKALGTWHLALGLGVGETN